MVVMQQLIYRVCVPEMEFIAHACSANNIHICCGVIFSTGHMKYYSC